LTEKEAQLTQLKAFCPFNGNKCGPLPEIDVAKGADATAPSVPPKDGCIVTIKTACGPATVANTNTTNHVEMVIIKETKVGTVGADGCQAYETEVAFTSAGNDLPKPPKGKKGKGKKNKGGS